MTVQYRLNQVASGSTHANPQRQGAREGTIALRDNERAARFAYEVAACYGASAEGRSKSGEGLLRQDSAKQGSLKTGHLGR